MSPSELLRYHRHLLLPEVGKEGQAKLKNAKVLVIGCGGLGNAMLPYLAAAGVGNIGIVDFDKIDESNLQRQIMYGQSSVGRYKTEVMTERLREINPFIDIHSYNTRLTSENALQMIRDYDIVADGTDNFPTRYLVNDACVLLNKVNVFASIFRFDLQLSVFHYHGGPCYRCLFPEPPAPGTVPSCAEAGVFGVLPGVAGTLQANEIIKIITQTGEPLSGKLFTIDLLSFHPVLLTVDKDPACPVCGENPTVKKLMDYEEFCNPSLNMNEINEITVTELKRLLDSGENLQIIDVREPLEYEICNMGGTLIPLSTLEQNIDKIKKDIPVVVHCRSGKRSAMAVKKLKIQYGFKNTMNLSGGIIAWAQEIDPTLTVY